MDEAEKVLEQVDSMHLEFAKRAAVSKFEKQNCQIKAVQGSGQILMKTVKTDGRFHALGIRQTCCCKFLLQLVSILKKYLKCF